MPHCREHDGRPVRERRHLNDGRGKDGGEQVTREEALTTLAASRPDLDQFHVTSLSTFGSVARDEASADSDVDVLVELDPEAVVGLFEFVRLQRYLTQLLGRRVDLATPDALHKTLRASILGEAIRADLACPGEGDDSEDAEVIDDQVERVAGAVSGIILE